MSKEKKNTAPMELKLAVCGPGAVGKSSLTVQYISNEYSDDYDPTIEDAYRKHCMVDNVVYFLEITDTAGQDEFISLRDQYIRANEGFLLVFDMTSRSSMEQLEQFVTKIRQIKDCDDFPVAIAANKCDLENMREVTLAEAKQYFEKKLNMKHYVLMETSALKRKNCDEIFTAVVRQIIKFKKPLPTSSPSSIKPPSSSSKSIISGFFASSASNFEAEEDIAKIPK